MEYALNNDLIEEDKVPSTGVTWHLLAVGSLTLLWHCICAVRFLAAETGLFASAVRSTPELEMFASFPPLVSAFWAVGVWGGLAGSALLCMRSRWAVQGFVMSLVSVIGVSTWLFLLLGKSASIYDMPVALATWIVTLTALLYATRQSEMGALR